MPVHLLRHAITGEWLDTGEALVEDTCQGIGVAAFVGDTGGEPPGAMYPQVPHSGSGGSEFCVVVGIGDAEINQVGEIPRRDEDVGGLTSRCTNPELCAASKAAPTWSTTCIARSGVIAPSRARTTFRSTPSINGMTMNSCPSVSSAS